MAGIRRAKTSRLIRNTSVRQDSYPPRPSPCTECTKQITHCRFSDWSMFSVPLISAYPNKKTIELLSSRQSSGLWVSPRDRYQFGYKTRYSVQMGCTTSYRFSAVLSSYKQCHKNVALASMDPIIIIQEATQLTMADNPSSLDLLIVGSLAA